jgi:GNAT superfamily N-acetyltransferase
MSASPTPRFDLRPLTKQDEPSLWTMLYHAIYVADGSPPPDPGILHRPDMAKYVKDWGRPDDYGLAVISPGAVNLCGAAWLRLFTGVDSGYGYVDDQTPELSVAVLPPYRRQGIGTCLLRQLLQDARARYPFISLSVSAENPARRLYRRLGFEEVDWSDASVTMKIDLRRSPP